MGVKSTRQLTRDEAEEMYVDLRLQMKGRDVIRAEAVAMGNEDLAAALEKMNDAIHGGECFENYWVLG